MRTCDESEHEEEASGLPPEGHSIQSRLPGLLSALKKSAVAGKPLALFPGFGKNASLCGPLQKGALNLAPATDTAPSPARSSPSMFNFWHHLLKYWAVKS